MIALAIMVLGAFSFDRLNIDLLPKLIYPDIRVRVLDPGVPAEVMEDKITRLLEEQLSITENVISVQSRTSEGRSAVDLSFNYGTDINQALRDASTRLDRARRFLPEGIQPPLIYKRDPSQIPVIEFVIGSALRDPVDLRSWVEEEFGKWFLNIPGVAATEVGGGLVREILILPDQKRMAALGFSVQQLKQSIRAANIDTPSGRLSSFRQQLSGRTLGRFKSLDELAALPLRAKNGDLVRLDEIAEVIDSHEDEKLRVRVNGLFGVKLSVQKQPAANTVEVVKMVRHRIEWLKAQKLIPADIEIYSVSDQAVFIRRALDNATLAGLSGTVLAMIVVWLFLGNIRRTLIVSSAIPIALLVTFIFMAWGGLTLNIMTLGGLALGVGLLVDNTIVVLENIQRHQKNQTNDAANIAAHEVQSAVIAATSTNLAAVLPFLFISGLLGLLFRELIFTISAAIFASLIVALTIVPTFAARVAYQSPGLIRRGFDKGIYALQDAYGWLLNVFLKVPWIPFLILGFALIQSLPTLLSDKQVFLPKMDEGRISISLTGDTGITLDEMDRAVAQVEALLDQEPNVESVFTTVGGFIFGRSEYQSPNRSSINIQLIPARERTLTDKDWIKNLKKRLNNQPIAGINIRIRARGIRGVRLSRGDDDLSLRIQGQDLKMLQQLGDQAVRLLKDVKGLQNVQHSAEEQSQELALYIDRKRAADLNLSVENVGNALREALEGAVVSDYLDGGRSVNIRLRMPSTDLSDPQSLHSLLINSPSGGSVRLDQLVRVELIPAANHILRDRQSRIVEVSASLGSDTSISEAITNGRDALKALNLPEGYTLYDGGAGDQLQRTQQLSQTLLGLALFLVFAVMAVQYESLRNPLVILLSIPFALIGVSVGLEMSGLPLSIPVWLGLIMLAGIVVNNAIIVVEFIELERQQNRTLKSAIIEGARLRLRPVLMTTLTTVAGMLPLALALGEGTEMLQPLAVTIVYGLSFSMLVSLILVPIIYRMVHFRAV